jgi:hypothetical protein
MQYILNEQEYNGLKADRNTLRALEAGGVDNWEGYHESLKDAGLLEDEDAE